MIMVGKKAPLFYEKAAVQGKIVDLSLGDFLGKYVVLFFYPLDFTFVCPTELHAFEQKRKEFLQKDAQIIGCSVDSPYTHLAWLNTPKEEGGIQGVEYPILSDLTKRIAKEYGVLKEEEGVAYRGLFLIDKNGVIRHMLVNDLPLGRSVDEALRILDALIFHEKHGEVCPANWNVGEKAMKPDSEGVRSYFEAVAK